MTAEKNIEKKNFIKVRVLVSEKQHYSSQEEYDSKLQQWIELLLNTYGSENGTFKV